MLSSEQVQKYQNDGYLIPDYRLADETIQAIRRDHDALIARFPQFTDYCPSLLSYDVSFLDYARSDGLLDMVEQLIGPNIALWNSSFFAKPPLVGTRTPWHQDGEYWPIRPLATCSVWIAIDDANTSNGCLRFIPGSHRRRELKPHHVNNAKGLSLPLELEASSFNEDDAVDIELEAGQISLHDVFLMHASEPNLSSNPRRGMTLRFMPTTSVYRRDIEMEIGRGIVDVQRSLFLLRGRDLSGVNDFRLRPVLLA
ncbi:MAG: phytanoyl-CoA dioxygenase family protein [Gammaproteobacteria bacterium]|nr:phytanoyl-CoA dioxygenase family protein [Gammaproteobacteria bacterium]